MIQKSNLPNPVIPADHPLLKAFAAPVVGKQEASENEIAKKERKLEPAEAFLEHLAKLATIPPYHATLKFLRSGDTTADKTVRENAVACAGDFSTFKKVLAILKVLDKISYLDLAARIGEPKIANLRADVALGLDTLIDECGNPEIIKADRKTLIARVKNLERDQNFERWCKECKEWLKNPCAAQAPGPCRVLITPAMASRLDFVKGFNFTRIFYHSARKEVSSADIVLNLGTRLGMVVIEAFAATPNLMSEAKSKSVLVPLTSQAIGVYSLKRKQFRLLKLLPAESRTELEEKLAKLNGARGELTQLLYGYGPVEVSKALGPFRWNIQFTPFSFARGQWVARNSKKPPAGFNVKLSDDWIDNFLDAGDPLKFKGAFLDVYSARAGIGSSAALNEVIVTNADHNAFKFKIRPTPEASISRTIRLLSNEQILSICKTGSLDLENVRVGEALPAKELPHNVSFALKLPMWKWHQIEKEQGAKVSSFNVVFFLNRTIHFRRTPADENVQPCVFQYKSGNEKVDGIYLGFCNVKEDAWKSPPIGLYKCIKTSAADGKVLLRIQRNIGALALWA